MKKKHYAIIAIIIILVSALAVALSLSCRPGIDDSTAPSLIKPEHHVAISVPGRETINEMKRLEKIMPQLVAPSGINSSRAQLGCIGYHTYEYGEIRETGSGSKSDPHMLYSLSLAFWGGKKRFCVIDDEFYTENAILPDGGKIISIELNRVLIKKHEFTSWITLDHKPDKGRGKE